MRFSPAPACREPRCTGSFLAVSFPTASRSLRAVERGQSHRFKVGSLSASRPQSLERASMKDTRRRRTPRRFAMLPLHVLESDAMRTLSHAAFRVLVLLAGQFNGHNNGALGITHSQARKNGIGSRHTLYRALAELRGRGLIEQTFPASRVPPRPVMFALSWVSIDDTEYSRRTRLASNQFTKWQPDAA